MASWLVKILLTAASPSRPRPSTSRREALPGSSGPSARSPIRRDSGSASDGGLDAARGVLDAGGVFGIYPEGTRSPDGRLYRSHAGVARLALACRCPIVPVAMIGTRKAQPIGRRVPRPFLPITVRLGRPIGDERVRDRLDDRVALLDLTDELMYELQALSGQEYVPA